MKNGKWKMENGEWRMEIYFESRQKTPSFVNTIAKYEVDFGREYK